MTSLDSEAVTAISQESQVEGEVKLRNVSTTDSYEKSWEECAKRMKDHDEERVKAWKEEIDTLLVFAGLFSAVLTAFNVQSYTSLQSNPSSDTAVQLLALISTQLNSFSVNAGVINSTQSTPTHAVIATLQAQPVLSSSVHINALWFSSLVCSLSTASVSIVVKQWLNQYTSGLASVSRSAARTRQFRSDCLENWHVPTIIMVLPTLLQIALVLFFAGLLELLWTLNHTVSIVAAVFVAILGLFQLVTTVLPASVPDCPYQSPQALGFIILVKLSRLAIGKICRRSWNYVMNCCGDDLPVAFHWQDRGLWTARRKFALSVRRYIHYIDNWLNMVVAEKRLYNWRERERMIVDSNGEMLDTRMLIAADLTFTDNAFLETVVRRCLTGMKVEGATQCFHRIVDHCSKHPWQVSALQHGIKVDRSGAALINIALDIIMMVEPHRLHNSTVLPLLRFLSTNMRWTSPSSSTQWQQLFDVGVSLLCNEWNEIRYLAFDITAFSFRVAPELNKVTLSSSGLQAMASYLEFSEVKGDKWRSLVATDLLLDCAASNCLSDVDLNAVQADVQKPLRDFFCLWEMVPLVDHPSYVLLGIGTSFVQFARRNTGHVEIGLIEVIVRMFSAYGTANVFSNEAERQAKEKLVNLLLDLDAILNWYMLAELPGP